MEKQRNFPNLVNKSTESLNTLSFVEYLLSDLESYEKAFIHEAINMKDLINSKTGGRSLYSNSPEKYFVVAQLNDHMHTIIDVQKELSDVDKDKHIMKKLPNKGDKNYLNQLNFSDVTQITEDQKEESISPSFEDLETTRKINSERSELQEINNSSSNKFDNFMQTCGICKANNDEFEFYYTNSSSHNSESLSTLISQISNVVDISGKFENVGVATSNIDKFINPNEISKKRLEKRKTKQGNTHKVKQPSDSVCYYSGAENDLRILANVICNHFSDLPAKKDRVKDCDACSRNPSNHKAPKSAEINQDVIQCDDCNSDEEYKTIRTITKVTRYLNPNGTIQEVKETLTIKQIPEDPKEKCLHKTQSKSQQIDSCCASKPKYSNNNRNEHDPEECTRPDFTKKSSQEPSSDYQEQCESCIQHKQDKGHKQRSSKKKPERSKCYVCPKETASKIDLDCDLCDEDLHKGLKFKQTTKSMTTDGCKICHDDNKNIQKKESSNIICAKCEISKEQLCEKHKNISKADNLSMHCCTVPKEEPDDCTRCNEPVVKSKGKNQQRENIMAGLKSDSKCKVCADKNKMKPKKSKNICDTCSAKMLPKCKSKPSPKVSCCNNITVKNNNTNCLKSDVECGACLKSKQTTKSISTDSCNISRKCTNKNHYTSKQNQSPNIKYAKCEISEDQLCEKHEKNYSYFDCMASKERPDLEDFTMYFESPVKSNRKKQKKENTMDCLKSDTQCNVCADEDKIKLKDSNNSCDACYAKMLLKCKSEPSPDISSCSFTFIFKGKSKMTKKSICDTCFAKMLPKFKLQTTPDEPCCHVPVKENKVDCLKTNVCQSCAGSDEKRTKSKATKNTCSKYSAKPKSTKNTCNMCSAKCKSEPSSDVSICQNSAKKKPGLLLPEQAKSSGTVYKVMSSKSPCCTKPVCPKESKVQMNIGSVSYTSSTSNSVCSAFSHSISEIMCGDCGQVEFTKKNEPCCLQDNKTGCEHIQKKLHDDNCSCLEDDQKQDKMKTSLLPNLPRTPQCTQPKEINKKQVPETCSCEGIAKNPEVIYPEDDDCMCPEDDQVKNKTKWVFDRTETTLPPLPKTPHSTEPNKSNKEVNGSASQMSLFSKLLTYFPKPVQILNIDKKESKDDEICSSCSACQQNSRKDTSSPISITYLPDSGVILSFEQPKQKEKEICSCKEILGEPDNKTPLAQDFGLYESKTRVITRVTRFLDPDGIVQEKREVITIKQEMHDPEVKSIDDVKTTSYWDESNVYSAESEQKTK